VRTDNDPEFTSRAFIAWTQRRGIEHLLIEPGRPMQNGGEPPCATRPTTRPERSPPAQPPKKSIEVKVCGDFRSL
jgi:transposase InsO family protein